jgi:hypothetical protein
MQIILIAIAALLTGGIASAGLVAWFVLRLFSTPDLAVDITDDEIEDELPELLLTVDKSSVLRQNWLTERKEKIQSGLAELEQLKDKLTANDCWYSLDETRLQKLKIEAADYVNSIYEDLAANFDSYIRLFQEGPFTKVAFLPGGWSMSWNVWTVDAHIELLTIKSRTALALVVEPQNSAKQRFLDECERCIVEAGFDGTGEFPRYRTENVIRKIVGTSFIKFEAAPFGLSLEQALPLVRVAASLPDDNADLWLNSAVTTEEIVSQWDAYRQVRSSCWRPLTEQESAQVREQVKQLQVFTH